MRAIIFVGLLLMLFCLINPAFAGISSVSLIDDTIFDDKGKVWLLKWSSMYSDAIEASMSVSDIKDETGYESERGFTMGITSGEEYGLYNLKQERTIPEVEIVQLDCVGLECITGISFTKMNDFAGTNCIDLNGDYIKSYARNKNLLGVIVKVACFGEKSVLGDVYKIDKKADIFSVNWEFKPAGKTAETFSISNDNNVEAGWTKRIDDKLYIRWGGSFSSQYSSPTVGETRGSKTSSGISNLIEYTKYNNWLAEIDSDGVYTVVDYLNNVNSKSIAESKLNTPAKYIFIWSAYNFESSKTTFIDSQFKYDNPTKIWIPSFDVYIDGDYYVKVILPKGEPKITSFTVPDSEEEQETYARVTVKNIGESIGDFELRITCTNGVRSIATDYLRGISPSTSKSKDILLIFPQILNEKEGYTCTITAKDLTSGLTDESSASGFILPGDKCQAGKQIVKYLNDRWSIWECDVSTGDYTNLIETCKIGEDVDKNVFTGKYSCVSGDVPPPPPTPDLLQWLQDNILLIIIGILIFGTIILVVVKVSGKPKGRSRRR